MKIRNVGLLVLAAALCACGGWWVMHGTGTANAADPAPPPEVPVTSAVAKVQDVPVFLSGLGTVQALNVVNIKAQVNGNLIALPAREGQEVHKATSSPRSIRVPTRPRSIRRRRPARATRRSFTALNSTCSATPPWRRSSSPRCSRWTTSAPP